jgi:hypothetical protein
MTAETMYRVRVWYREPTYEARTGPRATPFRWTYTVRAEDEAHARRRALREFEEMTLQSAVGWSREVVSVEVEVEVEQAR